MSAVSKELEMGVSAEALFKAITDFEGYPTFLPEVVSAKVLAGANQKKARVKFEINLMKSFEYTLEFTMSPTKEVSWRLEESNFFKKNEGRWRLTPQGAKSTAVVYDLDVGFGFFVPGWVAKKLTEVNLPTMLQKFEERAKSLE